MKSEEFIWRKLDGDLSQEELQSFEQQLKDPTFKATYTTILDLNSALKQQKPLSAKTEITEAVMLKIQEKKAVSKGLNYFSPPYMTLFLIMISLGPAILITHFSIGMSWQTMILNLFESNGSNSLLFLAPAALFSILVVDAIWTRLKQNPLRINYVLT